MPSDQQPSLQQYNELIEKLLAPKPTYFSFQVDGVIFTVRTKNKNSTLGISVVAELGFFPYTQESSPRRRLLATLINNAKLPVGKFMIGDKGRVFVAGELAIIPNEQPPESFTRFLITVYRMRPYLQLMGALF
jgi:hypothetical protein